MKTKSKMFGLAVTIPLVGLIACLAVGQPKVHENSRRIDTNPEHIKKQQESLDFSSLGHTALFHKNYGLAEKDLRQAIALDNSGGDVGMWADFGRVLDEQGRSEEAYAAYREAYDSPTRGGFSNFPNDVETLTHYGIMCEDHGQHEAAVRAYNKAVEELNPRQTSVALNVPADPQQTSTPCLRALLNVMRGLTIGEEKNVAGGQDRTAQALAAFQAAAQQEPNDARVNYYLGFGYQKAGNVKAAQTAFANAARLDTEGTVEAAALKELPGAMPPR